MPTWPASVPIFRLPTAIGFGSNTIRTPADRGPAASRRRGTSAARPFSTVGRWTNTQYQAFETFYLINLKDGSLEFDLFVPDPINATKTFRFAADPSPPSRQNGRWVTVLQLEILP